MDIDDPKLECCGKKIGLPIFFSETQDSFESVVGYTYLVGRIYLKARF